MFGPPNVLPTEEGIMNEQDNIELIRKIYAAFAGGDAQTILANVDDRAEME